MTILTTERLRLVPMQDDHLEGLCALNSDPQVMRYISGRAETREETMAMIDRVRRRWIEVGYSWWSFFDRETGEIVGAGAIQNLRKGMAPEPDPASPLEIGWRLKPAHWRRGLATEAAQAMAAFAFDTLHAEALYAVCNPDNLASANVMKRLGMSDGGLQTWYGRSLATYQTTAHQWRRFTGKGGSADDLNQP